MSIIGLVLLGLNLLGLIGSRIFRPDSNILLFSLLGCLIIPLGILIFDNRRALATRNAAFGFHSIITALIVITLIGVINFLGYRYPYKKDFTKNNINTFSEQTNKLIKELPVQVQSIFFSQQPAEEKYTSLLNNYRSLNATKFSVEFVDPAKDLIRTRQFGIKAINTLLIQIGDRNQTIEQPTEEKITNALIKLIQKKKQTLCVINGHGEKDFENQQAEGFSGAKKGLENQGYTVQNILLSQQDKISEDCNAITLIGANKSFFEKELKMVDDYLSAGGRAFFTLDIDEKGQGSPKELLAFYEKWFVTSPMALILDLQSRAANLNEAVPLVTNFSETHPIAKDFRVPGAFPFARPLEFTKQNPEGFTTNWVAKTGPNSWGETDFPGLRSGKVTKDSADKLGPLDVMLAIEGNKKDSKATQKTRIVFSGSSHFGTNNFSRFGGNLDLFLNSMSWVLEDESLISIRIKEDDTGRVDMTAQTGALLFWLLVVLYPLTIMGLGIWSWRKRKGL